MATTTEQKQVDHRDYAQKNLTQAVNQAQRVDGADDPEALGLVRATIANAHASLAIAEQLERLNDQLAEVIDPGAGGGRWPGVVRVRTEGTEG